MGKMIDPAELSKRGFLRGIFGGDLVAESIDSEKKVIVHYASTKTVDSYGTVILPDAFDETRFAKNPVVPWVHDYYSLPVARSMWRKFDEKGMLCATEFYPGDFPQEVFRYYELGFLKGWSIGFDWLQAVRRDSKEDGDEYKKIIEKWGIDGDPWIIFTRVDLWEYSAVPIPANPDALTKALRDGQIRTLPFRKGLESVGITMERKSFAGEEFIQHIEDVDLALQISEAEARGEADEPETPAEPDVEDLELDEPEAEEPAAKEDEPDPVQETATLEERIAHLEAQFSYLRSQLINVNGLTTKILNDENKGLEVSAEQLAAFVAETVRGEIQKLRGKVSQ